MQTRTDLDPFNPPRWRSFWAVAGALTILRIIVLLASLSELGPDEAQYWFWSRNLDFGYFSKPPMIAWAIGLATSLFGHEEWAVRLSAPLFHFGAASFLYLAASNLFDKRIAFWTGLGWLTIPGVILSSFIIATDAPLLFFWSGGLYVLSRIITAARPAPANFAWLGAAIGLGLMSKYAMMYFIAALGVSMLLRPMREKLVSWPLAMTAIIALALFAPNIIWNLQHDFQTLSHTAANAHWNGSLFKPLRLAEFLGGQFLVFGVILFATLIFICTRPKHLAFNGKYSWLFVFALTPLIIVATQSFISRAHANWAASAYPAAILLTTAFLFHINRAWLAKLNIGIHAAALAAFSAGVVHFSFADVLGLSGAVKDLRGWQDQTAAIVARSNGYDAILVDDRYLISEMLYHQKDAAIEIVALDPNAGIDNHFEAFLAFDPKRHKRTLFVTTRDDDAHVNYRFRSIKKLGAVEVALGGEARRYTLFEISGYFGPGAE